jgi:poly(A) polymerase
VAALARFAEAGYLGRADAARVRTPPAARAPPAGTVAERRFLHGAGDLWPAAVAVVSAHCRSRGDLAWLGGPRAGLLALAGREGAALLRPPRLLTGDEVQALLGVEAGPAVGRALKALREAQVDGRVRTREDALALLARRRDRPG